MSSDALAKIVNLLSFVALGLTILLIVRTRLEGQVRVFGLQSLVLALLSMLIALYTDSLELFGVGFALLVVKSVIIPRVLNRAVAKIGIVRTVAPYLGTAQRAHDLRPAHHRRFLRYDTDCGIESLANRRCYAACLRRHADRFFYHGESPPRGHADSRLSHVGKRHLPARSLGHLWSAIRRRDGRFLVRSGSRADHGSLRLSHQRQFRFDRCCELED